MRRSAGELDGDIAAINETICGDVGADGEGVVGVNRSFVGCIPIPNADDNRFPVCSVDPRANALDQFPRFRSTEHKAAPLNVGRLLYAVRLGRIVQQV